MKAMSIEQYCEIVNFVQKHHRFALWKSDKEKAETLKEFPKLNEYGFNIKYIDHIYDSRDSRIWMVKFRGGGSNLAFSSNHFNVLNPVPKNWKYESLYELCMDYLKGEFQPKEEFFIKKNPNQ